jgi:superkiller protein 3
MFRGLALMHLGRHEETEKCYIHAYRLQPTNPLAVKGIPKLYQEKKEWEKLGRFLESRVQDTYNE